EDGIRGFHVTGAQTCALPIFRPVIPAPTTTTSARRSPASSVRGCGGWLVRSASNSDVMACLYPAGHRRKRRVPGAAGCLREGPRDRKRGVEGKAGGLAVRGGR